MVFRSTGFAARAAMGARSKDARNQMSSRFIENLGK
jgi:hypothetical protein